MYKYVNGANVSAMMNIICLNTNIHIGIKNIISLILG